MFAPPSEPVADLPSDAGAAPDMSATAPAPQTPLAEAIAIGERTTSAYDRSMRAQCQCLVERGSYATQDECLTLLGSGDDWAECGAGVLVELDSPAVRAATECFIRHSEAQADCLERTGCDADAAVACDQSTALVCFAEVADVVLSLLQACPDLGLLSRVAGP